MRADLRERREATWERLIVRGERYSRVCEDIAEEYDVEQSTVETDISRMDSWVPKLIHSLLPTGLSRMKELRRVRRELYAVAEEQKRAGELNKARLTFKEIGANIERDIKLSQSLGLATSEPDEHETTVEVQSFSEDLTDEERRVLDAVTGGGDGDEGTGALDVTHPQSNRSLSGGHGGGD